MHRDAGPQSPDRLYNTNYTVELGNDFGSVRDAKNPSCERTHEGRRPSGDEIQRNPLEINSARNDKMNSSKHPYDSQG